MNVPASLFYPTSTKLPYNVASVRVITPPTVEPVDLPTAKQQCRSVVPDEDGLIALYISAARANVEQQTGLYLINQQLAVTFDYFDTPLRLPVWPLVSVDSIHYTDTDGADQTLDPSQYVVDGNVRPPRVFPAYNVDWPDIQGSAANVTVNVTVGYANAAAVPQGIKAAILLLTADMFENREATAQVAVISENPTVDRLLFPYQSMWL